MQRKKSLSYPPLPHKKEEYEQHPRTGCTRSSVRKPETGSLNLDSPQFHSPPALVSGEDYKRWLDAYAGKPDWDAIFTHPDARRVCGW